MRLAHTTQQMKSTQSIAHTMDQIEVRAPLLLARGNRPLFEDRLRCWHLMVATRPSQQVQRITRQLIITCECVMAHSIRNNVRPERRQNRWLTLAAQCLLAARSSHRSAGRTAGKVLALLGGSTTSSTPWATIPFPMAASKREAHLAAAKVALAKFGNCSVARCENSCEPVL